MSLAGRWRKQPTSNPELWARVWDNPDAEGFWWWVRREQQGVRGRAILAYVERQLGGVQGKRVVEVGSGAGVYSLVFASLGADVTLLDYTEGALSKARRYFDEAGLSAKYVLGDAFNLPINLLGSFDIAMSFGTIEHYRSVERGRLAGVHCSLVRPGGIVAISVPNRWFIPHQAWKTILRLFGRWGLGYERALSPRELGRLADSLLFEDAEVRGSSVKTDLRKWLHVLASAHHLKGRLPSRLLRMPPPVDAPSRVDDLLGADLVLLGRVPDGEAE